MPSVATSKESPIRRNPSEFCFQLFRDRNINRHVSAFLHRLGPVDFLVDFAEIHVGRPLVEFPPHPMKEYRRVSYHDRCRMHTAVQKLFQESVILIFSDGFPAPLPVLLFPHEHKTCHAVTALSSSSMVRSFFPHHSGRLARTTASAIGGHTAFPQRATCLLFP